MPYKNLVFKGGGAKVFYSVGALEALEERAILGDIERVAGVSAGATLALLTALDMDADEMKDFFLRASLTEELDAKDLCAETLRLFENYGRYTGENLSAQIRDLLEQKTGSPDVTFAELHDLGFKDLYIFASDITNKKLLQLSWEDTPDYGVADAVRASSAYPFYFTPSYGPSGEILVDGGLLDNYPLWLFDEPRFLSDPKAEYNSETLGVHLGEHNDAQTLWSYKDIDFMMRLFNNMDTKVIEEKVANLDFSQVSSVPDPHHDFVGYLITLFGVGGSAPPKYHHPGFAGEIPISTNFVNSAGRKQTTFDLDTSYEVRLELMEHGRKEAHKFFERNCLAGGGECFPIQDDMSLDVMTHNINGNFISIEN